MSNTGHLTHQAITPAAAESTDCAQFPSIGPNVESILENNKSFMNLLENDKKWLEYVSEKLKDESLSLTERAYFSRILRVYDMPNLTLVENHPIKMLIDSIIGSPFYESFDKVDTPQIVAEFETFDLFNFPVDHVARRPSDSYFISKSDNRAESILLRPHTSVMWYHYLVKWGWIEKLEKEWEVKALSWWKVYRVDELDKTHHECFHQIDWLRITSKEKEIINQDTLKEVLWNTIKALFWDDMEYRFNEDSFPYTTDSLEIEVMYKWKWLEVTWAWVVHPTVLEKLWLDPEKYNGWAFGFWIERLVMALKQIPDIRIFWSQDKRITKQWWSFDQYKEVSSFPPVYKDISMVVPKEKFVKDLEEEKKSWELELTKNTESDFFAITWVIRDVWGDLIEEVKITDIYENDKKFWETNKSLTLKIVFRSIERTLTNEEINVMYFEIRDRIEKNLGYELR
ncbi:MAG: hypothetical protein ACD_2C00016G0012 [uncultured bacterium (gcode 4)]|uniref:Phenylalanyl-tRNA synthetase n=1 Tax=uncultured bacterium (gcode 4) TaxID=1234023 RepID=K2FGJ1_9BACT|nr:MAG: hypothetical protein ACD_2C00016G0012 [uncultured bacterium (gcode 4)]